MSNNYGWIGVDLDGTLAEYGEWIGVDHIGQPIPLMLARVKRWLADGQRVKIFTARVAIHQTREEIYHARGVVEVWCKKHVGVVLEVTCMKDFAMKTLWDDRAVQVIPNTGRRADGADDSLEKIWSDENSETSAVSS